MKRIIFTLLAIVIIAIACEKNEQATKTLNKEITEAVTQTDTSVVDDSGSTEPVGVITDGNKLNIKNFTRTDCKSKTKSAKKVYREYLELNTKGKYLKIKHVNVTFACCLEENDIKVTSKISNDTIFIKEKQTPGAGCDCICDYDLNYEVGILNYQKYHVILKVYDSIYKEFDLDFKPNTKGIINIKEKNY